jgi:hypothetical protein
LQAVEILKNLFFIERGFLNANHFVYRSETVDLYFDGQHQAKYETIMKNFRKRGIVKEQDGKILTTVKP